MPDQQSFPVMMAAQTFYTCPDQLDSSCEYQVIEKVIYWWKSGIIFNGKILGDGDTWLGYVNREKAD